MTTDARARKIKVLIFDVDGVLTDGQIFVIPNSDGHGIEAKGFSAHDGLESLWGVSAASASESLPSASPRR